MTPATATASDIPCSDHSYELPLRRNLLLLLDLLDVLRFVAGVLLDRLGVVSCEVGGVQLPGGDPADDDAAVERFVLEVTTLWEASSPPVTRRTRTAASRYIRRRRRRRAAVCAICLEGLGLEAGGGGCQKVVELGVCSHAFHAACIDAWAGAAEAATCPLCRAPLMLPTGGWQSLWPRSPR
ncbi:unnamed protein product [Urochloa humidicola]